MDEQAAVEQVAEQRPGAEVELVGEEPREGELALRPAGEVLSRLRPKSVTYPYQYPYQLPRTRAYSRVLCAK